MPGSSRTHQQMDAAGGGGGNVNIHDSAGANLTATVPGALDVNIVAGAGAGGTSMIDDAAFTPGATAITPTGAMFDDVAPDSVDEGDGGTLRMSANRNLYTTTRDAAGNERGQIVNAAGAAAVEFAGVTQPVGDGGGSLSVDDAGGTLTVDDGGLSLTVDNATISVVGGGVEATAQRVTIANDSTGILTVDNGGTFAVQADITGINGTIDTNNSTAVPLGGGAVFTGVGTDVLDVATVTVFVYSNVASAADGLSVQWSTDNANWDELDVFTIPAGNAKIFSFGPPSRYMRVVYTNGAGAQGAFRLQTITKTANMKPSSHRIDDSILEQDDAELVKAVLSGENPGGTFVNVEATNGGSLKVSLEEINTVVMPVEGDVADDAVDSGNPVKVGAKAKETDGSTPGFVAEDDRVDLIADLCRRLLVNVGHPNTQNPSNNNYAAAQTNTQQIAAPGAGLHIYITGFIMTTDTAMNIKIVDDTAGVPADLLGPYYFPDNGGTQALGGAGWLYRVDAATNVGITSSAAGNHTVTIFYYIAP